MTDLAVDGRHIADPPRTPLGAVQIADLLGRPRPTDEQVRVIEAPLEPVLVVAGAGSGKTETMAARVVYLVANGLVAPDRVLGLTFTRKAAGELSERVRRRLRALRHAQRRTARYGGEGSPSMMVAPTIGTYHSYAASLVGDHALRLGIEPSSRLLGEAGRWQLAHEVVEQWSADLEVDYVPATVTTALLGLSEQLAEHLVDPRDLRSTAEAMLEAMARAPERHPVKADGKKLLADVVRSIRLRAQLVDLVEELTARKRRSDQIDFPDQVALAARIAIEVPEVGVQERARFGVVLLDEYQDTSVAQLKLLGHLFGGAGDGAGHPVTAVGDPHQSIYGWRGASAGGLERFPEQFPRRAPEDGSAGSGPTPAHVLALSTSWRNDRTILAAANHVSAPLRTAATLELPELVARPGADAGEVTTAYLETADDEARAVAEFVAARRAELGRERAGRGDRAEGSGEADRGVAPVTAAVLCRKRSQFRALHAALLAAGLPVEVVGLGGLLDTPEVVDLVAALQAAHDPSRGDALMRLLTGPRARLGLADLHALADWSAQLAGPRRGTDGTRDRRLADGEAAPAVEPDLVDERSIVDALDDLPRPGWVSRHGRRLSEPGRARLVDLSEVLRVLRGQTFLPVVDLVTEAERLLGLDIEVAARPGVDPAVARANLDAFRSVAAAFDDTNDHGTLGAFLAWLDAAQQEERGLELPVGEMDPSAVQLLTVHAAKGLEWDVVAVPGLVERGFPSEPKTTGWIKDRGALPTVLRGDREDVPDVSFAGAADTAELVSRLERYRADHAAHALAEERRLAYVAITRARSRLLLSGSWWREGTRPTTPSVFLTEVADALDGSREPAPPTLQDVGVDAGGRVGWAADPRDPDGDGTARVPRPVKPEPPAADPPLWPSADPPAQDTLHAARTRAAAAVRAAMRSTSTPGDAAQAVLDPGPQDGHGPGESKGRADDGPLTEATRLAELLLAERRRGRSRRSTVALPGHLSASAVVRLAADPDQFARQLRRPIPLEPSTSARRGTRFHAWVERYFGAAALVDVETMPGADDDSVVDDLTLADLRTSFLASPWARRMPIAVEVDIETPVGGVVLRSRIDAVFPDHGVTPTVAAAPGGGATLEQGAPEHGAPEHGAPEHGAPEHGAPPGVVVVDWKTGRPPTDPAAIRARELQLAVYRLAWSRSRGVPIDHVRAAFFYVATGQTVWPERLLGAEEIEAVITAGVVQADGTDGEGAGGPEASAE